jgi:hypothetical protein
VKAAFTGGCACGAIRYECSAAPLRMVNCHCRDCQLAGGSAYAPTVVVPRAALVLTKGQPAVFEKPADSGNIVRREFCARCGTPLYAGSSARPQFLGIRAASVDDSSWFRAEADVWVGSAQPWDHLDLALPKFAKGRPAAGR